MPSINSNDIPDLVFSPWRHWKGRPRPSKQLDVPVDWGLLGLYLLASEDALVALDQPGHKRHVASQILYIGMSRHVDRRLEKHHSGVRRYKERYGDADGAKLVFSMWQSSWSNTVENSVHDAALAMYERILLWEFAKANGRLPALNRC